MSFDDDLRAALQRRSADVSARSELLAPTVRRARRNQVVVASVASACVVALAAVVVALVRPGVDGAAPAPPATTPPPPTPVSLQALEGMQPLRDDGSVVVSGDEGELRWYLSVNPQSVRGDAVMCYRLQVETPDDAVGTRRCVPFGERPPLSAGVLRDFDGAGPARAMAFGMVSEVDAVVIRRAGGPAVGVRLSGVTAGIERSMRFFVAGLPPGARALVALDASGVEIGRYDVPDMLDAPVVNPRTGRRVVLARGTHDGVSWTLAGETRRLGPCLEMSLGDRGRLGSGDGCTRSGAALRVLQASTGGRTPVTPAFAVVPQDAATVTIERRGRVLPVEIRPARPGFPFRFFVAFPPVAPAFVVVRDASGEVIERDLLCAYGAPLGASCS